MLHHALPTIVTTSYSGTPFRVQPWFTPDYFRFADETELTGYKSHSAGR
jgi:hypothetical protein